MQLKTDKINRFGRIVLIKGLEVSFDKLGVAEVSEEDTEKLIKAGLRPVTEADISKMESILKSVSKPVSAIDLYDENLKLKVLNSKLQDEISSLKKLLVEAKPEDGKPEDADSEFGNVSVLEQIDSMKKAEIQSYCTDFPAEEWQSLKLEDLRAYLKLKLAD